MTIEQVDMFGDIEAYLDSMIPTPHQQFIDRAVPFFEQDERFVGLLGAGSMITGEMDEHSDIDLVAVYRDEERDALSPDERMKIVESLGPLLNAFTGEHVGEPRLLICLYKDPLLHVDVKFVSLTELAHRVEDPIILFEEAGCVTAVYKKTVPHFPAPTPQWIEDRFWTWIHYGTVKLQRGELFEAVGFLSYLRSAVFGPLLALLYDEPPRGVRKVEFYAADHLDALQKTHASYDVDSCVQAIDASISLYQELRSHFLEECVPRHETEQEVITFFREAVGALRE